MHVQTPWSLVTFIRKVYLPTAIFNNMASTTANNLIHFLQRHIWISQASIKAVAKTFSKEQLSPVITCISTWSKLSKMYFLSKEYLTLVQSTKCWFNYLFGLDRYWALVSTLSQFYWSLIYKVLVMMNMSITEKTWTDIYAPCTTKLWWVYWFHSICLSCMPCPL